jgi:hypothetical protein
MDKRFRDSIYRKIVESHIENEPARKAVPVAEYLYHVHKTAGLPNVFRQGMIWKGMRENNIPFYYGENNDVLMGFKGPDERVAEEFDCLGIGLEVLDHLGWVNACDVFKVALSKKGVERIEE